MKRSNDKWPKRILLIDDDAWIRDAMAVFFEGDGLFFLAVETAEEGLEALSRRHYDIVICDYRLPGMDGLSFFKRIQGKSGIKLLITAYGTETLPIEARAVGVDECLFKPLDMHTIESVLKGLIEGAPSGRTDGDRRHERGKHPAPGSLTLASSSAPDRAGHIRKLNEP